MTDQFALGLDAEPLDRRLQRLGLPPEVPVRTHANRTVLVSHTLRGVLRVHQGYAAAPDEVLTAIVRFVTPQVRRHERLAARRTLVAFGRTLAAPDAAPRRRRAEAPRPGDEALLARLGALQAALIAEHFGGALRILPLRLSGRMRRRLGELVVDPHTREPSEIGLSRRHLRCDGWAAVRDTLLHELVHQWQAESGRPVDHGPAFRAKAREVGIAPRAVVDVLPAR